MSNLVAWGDESVRTQGQDVPAYYMGVAAIPLDGSVSSERARRKCLELLLPVLEYEYGVNRLVLEARESHQDDRDLDFARGIRSRHIIETLRVDFKPGNEDARLWIPDQVLGALGDTRNGTMDFSPMVASLDLRTS